MSDQPTALQLAAHLEAELVRTVDLDMTHHRAAAELRRQHDRIEALEAQVREQALNYLSLDGQAQALADRIKELEATLKRQDRAHHEEVQAVTQADEALLRQALRILDFYGTVYGVTPKDLKTIAAIRARLEGKA